MRTIVFPSRNNTTYRSGYIKLTAIGSEFDQTAIEGHTNTVVDKLKSTQRHTAPDFDGVGLAYLENAMENMRAERSKMTGQPKFIAILPLPLSVRDATAVEWNSSPSSFIDGAYGKIKNTGVGSSNMAAMINNGGNMLGNYLSENSEIARGLGASSSLGSDIVGWLSDKGVDQATNPISEFVLTGSTELSKAVANSPAAMARKMPGRGSSAVLGMQSESSLMNFHNEAAALNGVRQVIYDPGYWQSFQGVNPRQFTLSWDIIPENHEDAINGLEMCARIREFSLPQSVSGVELLSPCYWQVDWSNKYLDSQTLYSSLIINNIEVSYAEQGEWNGASTPKMFKISITFSEAKAPTADIYKNGDSSIDIKVANNGGGSGSQSTSSKGGLRSGRARGGKAGKPGYDGAVGTFGKAPGTFGSGGIGGILGGIGGGTLGDKIGGIIGSGKLGPLSGIAGQIGGALGKTIDGVANVVGGVVSGGVKGYGDLLGDKVGGLIGGAISGNIGKVLGDVVDNAIDDIASSAGKVLKDAITTGDFKDLDKKLGKAAEASALGTVAGAVTEVVGGKIVNKLEEYYGKDLNDDVIKDVVGSLVSGAIGDNKGVQAIADKIEKESAGWVGGATEALFGIFAEPWLVKVEDKAEDIITKTDRKVEDLINTQGMTDVQKADYYKRKEQERKEQDALKAKQREEERKAKEEALRKEAERIQKANEEILTSKKNVENQVRKNAEADVKNQNAGTNGTPTNPPSDLPGSKPKEPVDNTAKVNEDKRLNTMGNRIAVGDSFAKGMGLYNPSVTHKLGVQGRSPAEVYTVVRSINKSLIEKSEVWLSTGTASRIDSDNTSTIRNQLQYLVDAKPCAIIVAGVSEIQGSNATAALANRRIENAVNEFKAKGHPVIFTGAVSAADTLNDNIHPKNSWYMKAGVNFTGCSLNKQP